MHRTRKLDELVEIVIIVNRANYKQKVAELIQLQFQCFAKRFGNGQTRSFTTKASKMCQGMTSGLRRNPSKIWIAEASRR